MKKKISPYFALYLEKMITMVFVNDWLFRSLVESPPQAEVAQQSIEQRHGYQNAQLELQRRIVYPNVVQ